jgi:acyl carrier protein
MTRHDVLRLLEETLDLPADTLQGGERLRDLEAWDSLSAVAFIAMVDQKFGLPLPGNRVVACRTVDDLIGLLGDAVSGRAA